MLNDSDREQAERGFRVTHDTLGAAARGLAILHRLVPAPDHGAGFRRDPETGFVYYSSEWLSDEPPPKPEPPTALYDLPIFEWAWKGDARDTER